MPEKPTLYLETSIVSYLTASPSQNIILQAHQEITCSWWRLRLGSFAVFISEVVLDEARRGDSKAARRRLEALSAFPALRMLPEVEQIAAIYMDELGIPPHAARDALHIALASVWAMDYLLTWNCRHIANGRVRRRVREINAREHVDTPTICTPEELLDDEPVYKPLLR